MVLEIRLSNFFSIKEEIVLDMRACNSNSQKSHDLHGNTFESKGEKILKSAVIYGANASGKSNIIRAIRFCCSMVLNSHLYNENTVFSFSPFKFEECDKKESCITTQTEGVLKFLLETKKPERKKAKFTAFLLFPQYQSQWM